MFNKHRWQRSSGSSEAGSWLPPCPHLCLAKRPILHYRKLLESSGPVVESHEPSPGTGEQASRVNSMPLKLSRVLTLAGSDQYGDTHLQMRDLGTEQQVPWVIV